MTTATLETLVESCLIARRIDARDVQLIARDLLADGIETLAQAEMLIRLNQQIDEKPGTWHAFFVPTLVDYLLSVQRPAGRVTAEQADWLLALIAGRRIDGHMRAVLVALVRDGSDVDSRIAPLAFGAPSPRSSVAASIGWLDAAGIGA